MTEKKRQQQITNPIKIVGNPINARILVFLRTHPSSPRDLSIRMKKDEADIVRRLRAMQRAGLVRSVWGKRLGKNVKLYSLAASDMNVLIRPEGLRIAYNDRSTNESVNGGVSTGVEITDKMSESPSIELEDLALQIRTLVGRRQELEILHQKELKFIFIVGVAGVGKTGLARKFAYEFLSAGDYSSSRGSSNRTANVRVFWHTFNEIDTLDYLIGRLAIFLANNGTDELLRRLESRSSADKTEFNTSSDLALTYLSLNRLKDCVIIFDDYHKVKDERISVLLRTLLTESSRYMTDGPKLIVLSRFESPFYLDKAYSKELRLSGLQLEEAKEIIDLNLNSIDLSSFESAWERFAGHPMALKIVSLFAQANSRRGIGPGALDRAETVDELLGYFQKEIFSILDEDELNVLLLLSVFRMPVKFRVFRERQLTRLSRKGRTLAYLLRSLQKKMLITVDAKGQTVSLHDMLREAVYSTLVYPADLHATAAQYYLMEGGTGDIVESVYHLSKCRNTKKIIQLFTEEVEDERYGIVEKGYAASLLHVLQDVDQIINQVISDQSTEMILLKSLRGKALAAVQKREEANLMLDQAINLAEKSGDKIVLACALKNYGEASYLQGSSLQAVEEKLCASAGILADIKSHLMSQKLQADVYMKLARLYFMMGKHDKARIYSEKVKEIPITRAKID